MLVSAMNDSKVYQFDEPGGKVCFVDDFTAQSVVNATVTDMEVSTYIVVSYINMEEVILEPPEQVYPDLLCLSELNTNNNNNKAVVLDLVINPDEWRAETTYDRSDILYVNTIESGLGSGGIPF